MMIESVLCFMKVLQYGSFTRCSHLAEKPEAEASKSARASCHRACSQRHVAPAVVRVQYYPVTVTTGARSAYRSWYYLTPLTLWDQTTCRVRENRTDGRTATLESFMKLNVKQTETALFHSVEIRWTANRTAVRRFSWSEYGSRVGYFRGVGVQLLRSHVHRNAES